METLYHGSPSDRNCQKRQISEALLADRREKHRGRKAVADGIRLADLPKANGEIQEGAVRRCKGLLPKGKKSRLTWKVELGAAPNYGHVSRKLALSGDLYRDGEHGHALIQVLPNGKSRLIAKGASLAPVIVDRIKMRVVKEGKLVSELPTAAHLNAMLRSEAFLSNFLPLDEVTREASASPRSKRLWLSSSSQGTLQRRSKPWQWLRKFGRSCRGQHCPPFRPLIQAWVPSPGFFFCQ